MLLICKYHFFFLILHWALKLDLHRHGLSKSAALQAIVKAQRDKWPTLVHGKFTSKTTMATMCAALLNQELGFTIHISEPVQSDHPEGQDEGQVPGSPDENPSQTVATESVDQPVEGVVTGSEEAVIDSNEQGVFMVP